MTSPSIEADVLVVGGGIAGCVAALQAAAAGARVVVVDKARSIRRSGDAGRGLAFLTTYLDLGEAWDTPEAFAGWYRDIALGLVDMDVAWPLAVEPLPAVCELLESVGLVLRQPGRDHERVGRMWTPGPIVLKFDGADIKPKLAERVLATDAVTVVGGVHVTSVQTDHGGRAVGATGFDIRTAEWRTFLAGAVIVATGNAERVIFNSARRDAFNTYHRPYHATTGFALAAKAGAEAANLEFLGTFLFPRGFATGAMGNLLEAGGRVINGNGDLVADLPDVPSERKFGFGIVGKAAGEVLAGRGPLYIDCTHLDPAVLADIGSYISYDAPLFREFLAQSGIDLRRHPVEFELFNGAWSATGSPKGVVVDGTGQTRVPGLFAAGDLATPAYALAGSLTSGYVAGRAAADVAGAATPELDRSAVEREQARVMAPLNRGAGIGWREYEHELQDLMTKYVGMDRNALGLAQAAEYLRAYRPAADRVCAANGHELMRAHEAFDLHLFDEMMTAAATERDETRFSFLMGHHRTDRPQADDRTWAGVAVVVGHDGERPHVRRTVPTPAYRDERLAALATAATANGAD